MKLTIPIEIECDEATCASEPGKFCHLFASDMQGDGVCYLYGKVFDNGDGWIERHPRCLETAVKQLEPKPTVKKTKAKP